MSRPKHLRTFVSLRSKHLRTFVPSATSLSGSVGANHHYLKAHVRAMENAIADGVGLMGYTWWGPIDIVSAGTGQFAKRYGFIYVDKLDDGTGDLHRVRKDSFFEYQRILASNGMCAE